MEPVFLAPHPYPPSCSHCPRRSPSAALSCSATPALAGSSIPANGAEGRGAPKTAPLRESASRLRRGKPRGDGGRSAPPALRQCQTARRGPRQSTHGSTLCQRMAPWQTNTTRMMIGIAIADEISNVLLPVLCSQTQRCGHQAPCESLPAHWARGLVGQTAWVAAAPALLAPDRVRLRLLRHHGASFLLRAKAEHDGGGGGANGGAPGRLRTVRDLRRSPAQRPGQRFGALRLVRGRNESREDHRQIIAENIARAGTARGTRAHALGPAPAIHPA